MLNLAVFAATTDSVPKEVNPIPQDKAPNSVAQILSNVIIYILGFSAALAVLFIIIGGLRFIISSGDQTAADQAKKIVLYAVLGLLIIIFSFVIVTFVTTSIAPVIVP